VGGTTYPGTVTPLRGLAAFRESERDVFFGRDGEREELAQLVTGDGFRAGLLYGETGVGKSSLLNAGLIPHLRDHGVFALPCRNPFDIAASFAEAVTAETGLARQEGERPIHFLARAVGEARTGQQYLFILDDVGQLLRWHDETLTIQLGDLFSRVVTRSGGRARFLFCCASARVHHFGSLERRTGSLFPPSSRFELQRFTVDTAAHVLEQTLALAATAADRAVGHAIAQELGRHGPILAADLQIASLAVTELNIESVDKLRGLGGSEELMRAWLTRAAAAAGNERAALRLLAELASDEGTTPCGPSWLAARANLDAQFATRAVAVLVERGLVREVAVSDGSERHFALAHDVLAQRLRELAAPARLSARRAYELLGSKAAQNKRLSARELLSVRREGIAPATPDEAAVIERTMGLIKVSAGVAVGVPMVFLLAIYLALSGKYYLDVIEPAHSSSARIVVRAGRPGLSGFFWLPASPEFGSVIADTGVTRPMVTDAVWSAISSHDIVGTIADGTYADDVLRGLTPDDRAILDYAITGDEVHLESFAKGKATIDDKLARLDGLRAIARGTPQETAIVEQMLVDESPAVQTAALAVASGAAGRAPPAYRSVLAKMLGSEEEDARHLAFAAVRGLGGAAANEIFREALDAEPSPAARAELLTAVTTEVISEGPSAASAASIIANSEIPAASRRRARGLLRRAFAADPEAAARAVVKLVSDHSVADNDRLFGLELVDEYAPKSAYADLVPALKLALKGKSEQVAAAAWPLFARMSPGDAALELVGMNERLDTLSAEMRVAVALSWGELARTGEPAAGEALRPLLDDRESTVRAAAARAYGFVGRSAQNNLSKLIKTERFDVAVGAAWGLANSTDVNAPTGVAIIGIAQLWKRKGKARRAAAEIFAHMARSKPAAVMTYLAAAARGKEDEGLKAHGVRGLCNALASETRGAAAALRGAANDSSTDVRRMVAECAVVHASKVGGVKRVADVLAGDPDPGIRADAARILASLARGKDGGDAADRIVKLATDDDRQVRIIAVRALGQLGKDAPLATSTALKQAFERRDADVGERQELLATARAVGAGDLVPLAVADAAPELRVAGLETAIGTGTGVVAAINGALADSDASVRRAALRLLAANRGQLDVGIVARALSLATRDSDPAIAGYALAMFARVGQPDAVKSKLVRELASPSEAVRTRAAAACAGLVGQTPKDAILLLEPLFEDPARDVRVAMVGPLANAYAKGHNPDELAKALRQAEGHPTRRLVLAAALFVANRKTGASRQALEAVKKTGPPLAAHTAALVLGLMEGKADGVGFLASRIR
jgi:DNA-binding MarR family transcriptional regulator